MTNVRGSLPGYPASRNDFQTIITNFSGTSAALQAGTVKTIAEHMANYNIIAIGQPFDGGGSTIPVNQTVYVPSPCAGTIVGYDIWTPDSGVGTVKTWQRAHGNTIPTSADLISTSGITLTTASDGQRKSNLVVTDFTNTAVAIYDLFGFTLSAVTSLTRLYFLLYIARTDVNT